VRHKRTREDALREGVVERHLGREPFEHAERALAEGKYVVWVFPEDADVPPAPAEREDSVLDDSDGPDITAPAE
jgi:hypothetical protein